MQISKIQNKTTFGKLYYDKTNKYLVDNFINPKECPQVYEDLQKLAKHTDIYVEMKKIYFTKNIFEPAIEYTLKPGFWKRLRGEKPFLDRIYINDSATQKYVNILPLKIRNAINALKNI